MCRIFGFRSVIQSGVHSSLVSADNALVNQSERHSDGWGVAYYVGGSPHVIRSIATALEDNLFHKVSGIVSSQTVVAHIRKITQGENSILNTHPFQHGKWTFAHNGNIKNFDSYRDELVGLIDPQMRRFILGKTDSEVIFYILLTQLAQRADIHSGKCSTQEMTASVQETVEKITSIVGPYTKNDSDPPQETFLTFLLTNGENMVAHQGGKNLYYSTYKTRCAERDTCPSFAPECEAKTKSGSVNHLIFSSEPLQGENIWIALELGQIVSVDQDMKLST